MDVSLPLDQIQSGYRFACSLINPTNFKHKLPFNGDIFSPRRKFSQFRCYMLDQGLRPRPMPTKPLKEFNNWEENPPEDPNSSSGICGQIEKLVLCKRYAEAVELFEILECESGYHAVKASTYDALIGACVLLRSITGVKRVFNHMLNSKVKLDLYMMNRVLLMHVRCGMTMKARLLFEDMPERNTVSWNMIIGGLVDSGDFINAFRLFLRMWSEEDDMETAGSRTFTIMIRASTGLELISSGQQLHACTIKMGFGSDVFILCALIDMYSKCGNIEDAKSVFYSMPEKTTVAWNSIIAGHALHGYSEEALAMSNQMQKSGAKMDHFTYSIIVRVCCRLASVEHAKQAHAGLVRNGFGSDTVASTALIDFYSKWGRLEDARNLFDRMPHKNVMSWNALIAGYRSNGRGHEAVELFDCMTRQGMKPNHVTFLAVLFSCCSSGLTARGWEIFKSMGLDHGVKPRAMHYACMVELLGREGLLDEAFALIRDAPFRPTVNMWAALLTACRVHKNLVLGKYAAERLYRLEPEKLSSYVVLLNIYYASGKMEEAAAVLRTLRRKGLRMLPVCTWIDIKQQQYAFFSGDRSHPGSKEIYDNLDEVMQEILKHGYVPQIKTLLPDVDEREQALMFYHSEKLAISYGLINTPAFSPLQFVQSHRICDDCHSVIKLISMVYKREIVFRDGSRFHRFRDGSCSCGDYW
ncbi:Pentatricopeptide repeat-containing protein -chloroplastic [Striga hermonthica]|uniref:Pentatricopeptide repeat-containing protein -chloroplastic n=1 Tax=Striga hermonthica TaxID=68872 RepID=A0A9N7MVG9_STRHE|nr:Pentatricopeptide repeat-containing protein -chloroplastic [Striga hermonthica]